MVNPPKELSDLFGISRLGILQTDCYLGGPTHVRGIYKNGEDTGYFFGGLSGVNLIDPDWKPTGFILGGRSGHEILRRENFKGTGYFIRSGPREYICFDPRFLT